MRSERVSRWRPEGVDGFTFSVLASRQSERACLELARQAFVQRLLPEVPPAARPAAPSRAPTPPRARLAVAAAPADLALGLVAGWQTDYVEELLRLRADLGARHAAAFGALLRSCAFLGANADAELEPEAAPDPGSAPPFACPPELCMGRRLLSPADVRLLAAYLALGAGVRALDAADAQLCADSARLLVGALRFAPGLRALSFAGNVIGGAPSDGGVLCALASELAREGSGLTSLHLSDCQLGDTGAAALAGALALAGNSRAGSRLARLSLAANQIGDEGADLLAAALAPPAQAVAGGLALEMLDLARNSIGPAGAEALARALLLLQGGQLGGAVRLHTLVLSRNSGLTIHAASVLARAASGGAAGRGPSERGRTISLSDLGAPFSALSLDRALPLRAVSIGGARDADVHLLAHDLSAASCALTCLRLPGSRLSDTSALALARALRTNCALLELDLAGNCLANAAACALGDALRSGRNTSLRSLSLASNAVADDGAAGLAAALADGCRLRALNLASNRLADGCAESLAAALRANTQLHALKLGGNGLSAEARAAVRAAWEARAERREGGDAVLSLA